MDLSEGDAFTVRELAARGFAPGRVAVLVGVDEDLVLGVLAGGPAAEGEPEGVPELAAPVERPARVRPVDVDVWPPPVDSSAEWDTVRVRTAWPDSEPIQVRWVLLWGQRVRINDANEVWCHWCLRFHTTAQLGHPFNGCPVGLPYRGGIVSFSGDELDDGPVSDVFGSLRW